MHPHLLSAQRSLQKRNVRTVLQLHPKLADGHDRLFNDSHAHIPMTRNVDENAITWAQDRERIGVPAPATSGDEAVLQGISPMLRFINTERYVIFAIPLAGF